MYCSASCSLDGTLRYTALHCCSVISYTALNYTALHFPTLHCNALHSIVLHCTTLQYTALHCSVINYIARNYTALHCPKLHYNVLLLTVLLCTTLALHCTVIIVSALCFMTLNRTNVDDCDLNVPVSVFAAFKVSIQTQLVRLHSSP